MKTDPALVILVMVYVNIDLDETTMVMMNWSMK